MSRVPGILLSNGQPAMQNTGGTIGVLSGARTVLPDFARALTISAKPDDTRLIWTESSDIVGNCNTFCRNFRGGWLWIMGDDHVFDPDLLPRLLERNVDVVVPLCLKRTPPYDPVVYGGQNEKGEFYVADLPDHGMTEVYAAGSAGMLIRRHVIEAIADPWFETGGGGMNEDLTFCAKVRDAGFRIWCDTDCLIGHITKHTVWPVRREGGWHADLEVHPGLKLGIRRELRGDLAAV
jgi:hypothetical protein